MAEQGVVDPHWSRQVLRIRELTAAASGELRRAEGLSFAGHHPRQSAATRSAREEGPGIRS